MPRHSGAPSAPDATAAAPAASIAHAIGRRRPTPPSARDRSVRAARPCAIGHGLSELAGRSRPPAGAGAAGPGRCRAPGCRPGPARLPSSGSGRSAGVPKPMASKVSAPRQHAQCEVRPSGPDPPRIAHAQARHRQQRLDVARAEGGQALDLLGELPAEVGAPAARGRSVMPARRRDRRPAIGGNGRGSALRTRRRMRSQPSWPR